MMDRRRSRFGRRALIVAGIGTVLATPAGGAAPKQVKCWHQVFGEKTYFYEQRYNIVAGKLQPVGSPYGSVSRSQRGTILMPGYKSSDATLTFSRGSRDGGPATLERFSFSGQFRPDMDGVSCYSNGSSPMDPRCTAPALAAPFQAIVYAGQPRVVLVESAFAPQVRRDYGKTLYDFELSWNASYPAGSLHKGLRIHLNHRGRTIVEYMLDATRVDPAAFVAETQAKLTGQVYPESYDARRASEKPLRNCSPL
ncbi:hypothetical protein P1X14_19245 [Sphingomonas sp. AOB5]|uniref:hypothetical protein n=1 Tax=Sphingomonas sp. AOB5 TaxID=3034017 RepID=UPI0023F6A105|nr:hypothetical protein [Sphingomonas sp. AOB5]MDF7777401.1 hypothetical protein [Sphingomonas sp. AOB5]